MKCWLKFSSILKAVTIAILVVSISARPNAVAVVAKDNVVSAPADSLSDSTLDTTKSKVIEEFVPTYEFQKVPPGVSVPPGLYIRMNMQTGEKEARKLLPSEIANAKSQDLEAVYDGGDSEEKVADSTSSPASSASDSTIDKAENQCGVDDESCKVDDNSENSKLLAPPEEKDGDTVMEDENSKRKMELKEALFWANKYKEVMKPQEDAKLIKSSLMELKKWIETDYDPKETSIVVSYLELIEDLSHQIDNAVDMANMGGITVLKALAGKLPIFTKDSSNKESKPSLDVSTVSAQSMALWALGTATQNNALVKEAAIEENLMLLYVDLLRLNITAGNSEVDDENQDEVSLIGHFRGKVLYAISTLMDSNRRAQELFWEHGGAAVVLNTWSESLNVLSKLSGEKTSRGFNKHRKVVRKVAEIIQRTISGFRSDPKLFSKGLVGVWLGSPDFCLLVEKTLGFSVENENLADKSLHLLKFVLDDEVAPSLCVFDRESIVEDLTSIRKFVAKNGGDDGLIQLASDITRRLS